MEIQESTPTINWRAQVTTWRESGLSMNRYCEQHGLVMHQLSYYKRKFQAELESTTQKKSGFSQVTFAPVQQGLTLQLSNGHLITGITSQNLPLINALVRALS